MEERNNNSVVTAVIVTVLVMIVLGLVGFIVYDKVINKTNEPSTGENDKVDNNEQNNDIVVDYDKNEAKALVDKYFIYFPGFGITTFDKFDEAAKICIAQQHINENMKKPVDCNKVCGQDRCVVENLNGGCWSELSKSVSYADFNEVYKSLFVGDLEKKDNATGYCAMDYNEKNNEFILLEFLGGGDSSDIYLYDVLSAKLTNENQLTVEVGYTLFKCTMGGNIENESCTAVFDQNVNYIRKQLIENGFEQQFIQKYSSKVKVLKFNFVKENNKFVLNNMEA